MIVVPDVSGMIQVLLNEEKAAKFNPLLDAASLIMAPDLYVSELTNMLWKYYRIKKLPKAECERHIQVGIGMVDEFVDSKELWQEAFTEGINNNHSAYDMFYFVIARRNDGTLITNDAALHVICKNNNVNVYF
jgi:predicted nucleic acid-binding protein